MQAFCPAPTGLHHAMANRATGMCIYNDAAVAIRALLERGAERIAYIDIDAHHGNGVQWIFYEDPRVLTVSVHESGRYLYPGTGGLAERGVNGAEGTSVNVPLPPFAGDGPYLAAMEEIVAPVVRRFRPDVVVTMTGVDPHHTDPMAHLQVTTAAFPRLYRSMRDMAFDAAQGRWLVVTGGGYNIDLLARLWAMQLARCWRWSCPRRSRPEWLAMASERAGMDFTPSLSGDTPFAADDGDARPRRRAGLGDDRRGEEPLPALAPGGRVSRATPRRSRPPCPCSAAPPGSGPPAAARGSCGAGSRRTRGRGAPTWRRWARSCRSRTRGRAGSRPCAGGRRSGSWRR